MIQRGDADLEDRRDRVRSIGLSQLMDIKVIEADRGAVQSVYRRPAICW